MSVVEVIENLKIQAAVGECISDISEHMLNCIAKLEFEPHVIEDSSFEVLQLVGQWAIANGFQVDDVEVGSSIIIRMK